MTPDEIRTVFIDELTRIAPDVEASTLSDEDHLMDDLGLDSMDILNLFTALQDRLVLFFKFDLQAFDFQHLLFLILTYRSLCLSAPSIRIGGVMSWHKA